MFSVIIAHVLDIFATTLRFYPLNVYNYKLWIIVDFSHSRGEEF
jgi:hypothetical protein